MRKFLIGIVAAAGVLFSQAPAHAQYQSRFEVINFDPVVDGGNYLTVYDSSTHKAWQGNLGFYLDYANRPLQIFVTGVGGGRQSIIDHLLVGDFYGSLGFTDWFTAGLNIPVVGYNWFFTDDALAASSHAAGMGDLEIVTKFRLLDIEKHRVGLALVPFFTLPTGDVTRYTGNGAVTGGANLAFDARLHEKFEVALNLGATLRDDVTRNVTIVSGVTGSISLDDQFNYGLAGVYKVNPNINLIAEVQGSTVMKNFFATDDNSPIEVDGAFRYLFNDSGFAATVGGGGGILDGIGNPRFRVFAGLNWTSPAEKELPPPPPDPKIVENKIILMGKIFFDTDKATIRSESFPVLDDVANTLGRNPQVGLVEIQGHCDDRGNDGYNDKLSDARANSARNYLISKGVDPSRLVARGYGKRQPIASNDTAEGMAQNRRTEFVILEQNGVAVPPTSHYIPSEPVTPPVNSEPVTMQPQANPSSTQLGAPAAQPIPNTVNEPIPTQPVVEPVSTAPMQGNSDDAVELSDLEREKANDIKPQVFPQQTAQPANTGPSLPPHSQLIPEPAKRQDPEAAPVVSERTAQLMEANGPETLRQSIAETASIR